MTIVDAIILGIIQGITEFLPISSTGHLILARELLNMGDAYGLAFDAILQLSTALAVLIYFWKDFYELLRSFVSWIMRRPGDYTMLQALILGTIPAAFLGLLLEQSIETIFRSSTLVALALIFGSLLFYLAERRKTESSNITASKGLIMGLFQALALIPGMSRSGSTLAGGLLLGLKRIDAARFSFLLSFPIICGAGVYKLLDLFKEGGMGDIGGSLILGSVFSFVFGMLSIHYLLRFLKNHTLSIFIYYRIALALIILAVSTNLL